MGKNKRPKSYYIQYAKRQKKDAVLGPDMVGFLCTCNFHERDCVREAYNVLNEFADKLYGKEVAEEEKETVDSSKSIDGGSVGEAETTGHDDIGMDGSANDEVHEDRLSVRKPRVSDGSDSDEEPLDIDAAIKADVKALKQNQQVQKKARRFQQVWCHARNCIFIRTTLPDPLPLSLAIMDDILESRKPRTQKLLRMIPVHTTCKAYPEDIKKAVEKLASSFFKEKGYSFRVLFKSRNNTAIKKENLVSDVAEILQKANSKNAPRLVDPEIVLYVDIMTKLCCLSLLPHYFNRYAKYNLVLLATADKKADSSDNLTKESEESTSEVVSETAVAADGKFDKTENGATLLEPKEESKNNTSDTKESEVEDKDS